MIAVSLTLSEIKREKERADARLYGAALKLIESRARKILAAHHNLDEFVMAMGGWLFTQRNGENKISDCDDRQYIPSYALPFARMMDAFDRLELKVTGEPMRFTARGPVVREWGATDGMDGKAVAAQYLKVRQ